MSTTEIFNYTNKSIVGASSIVAGSTWLPQSTLQAVGTTNLTGNVFINAGTIIPPNPFTSSSAQGGYSVTALEGTSTAWQVFNQNVSSVWEVTANYYSGVGAGGYIGSYSNIIDAGTSTQYNGSYVQLTCPTPITLQYYTLVGRYGFETVRSPLIWRVFGSTNGTTWYTVDSQTGVSNWAVPQVIKTFYLTRPVTYSYFALLVSNVQTTSQVLDISMWNLYTTPATTGLSVISGNVSIYQGGGLSVGTQNLGLNVAIFSNVGGSNVVINSNAWVGIGTTSPTASLHVVGDGSSGGTSLIATTQGIGSNVFVFSNTAGATSNNVMAMDSNATVLIGIQPSTAANYGGAQAYNAKARLYVSGGGTGTQPMNIVLYNPNLTNSNQTNGICFGGGGGASWHLISYYEGGGRNNFILGGDSGGGLNQYHKFTTTGLCVNSQLGVAQGPNVFHVLGFSTSNIAYFSNVAGGPNAVVINSNAWVGIGTSVPTGPLSVAGYSSANLALFTSTAPGGANVVVINSNAWVGIGTTNPTSSLQVNGNASFATDTFTVPFAMVGTMGVLSGLTIGLSSTTLGSNLAVFANASGGSNVTIFTGNALSIGTLTPTATLHVVGSMGSNIAVFSNGYSNGIFVINQWSNVGIGLANPLFQLDLSTDGGRQPTSSTWKTGSDQRVKSNIVAANLTICYDTIKSLDLKYFQWNFPDMNPTDQHSLGFIAQEVVNYFPKAVFPSDSHGFPDFLNINVDQILKAMYGALKKTIEDKEALEEKLEMAQNDIDLLETRLSDLEATVRTLLPQKETTQTGPRSEALINQM